MPPELTLSHMQTMPLIDRTRVLAFVLGSCGAKRQAKAAYELLDNLTRAKAAGLGVKR